MGFVCYVFDQGYPPPEMEPLAAVSAEAATREAARLLSERPNAHSIELWDAEGRLAVIHRDPRDPTEGDSALERPASWPGQQPGA
jgi:hypothetical protein